MTGRRRRALWMMQYREARVHAILVACIAWITSAIITFSTPGYRDLLGHLKGADFVHFYTLGQIALAGVPGELYDLAAQHADQARLVPESAGDWFVPIYPPQTALVFAPLARLPYGAAALLWAAVNVAVYAAGLRLIWRPVRSILPDGWFLAFAAAAFPPFWNLVLHGQTTAVPFVGFCLGWRLLDRSRPFLAGLALGLLAIKPQLGLVLAVVVLAGGEWSMLAGIALSVAVQLLAAVLVLGPDVLPGYLGMLKQLPQLTTMLEPRPYQLHSMRAVTSLLPPAWLGLTVWGTLALAVIVRTVRIWRSDAPLTARFGVLVLATALVSPPLTIYDATLLALPLVWLGAWVQGTQADSRRAVFWSVVYWFFVTLFFPTALIIRVQASVFIAGWLFLTTTNLLIGSARQPASQTT